MSRKFIIGYIALIFLLGSGIFTIGVRSGVKITMNKYSSMKIGKGDLKECFDMCHNMHKLSKEQNWGGQ